MGTQMTGRHRSVRALGRVAKFDELQEQVKRDMETPLIIHPFEPCPFFLQSSLAHVPTQTPPQILASSRYTVITTTTTTAATLT